MPTPISPPRRYGRYELLEHIGTGGMADVYLARTSGLGGFTKTVVVKRLRDEHVHDLEYRQMFIDEAKLAAQVQHKNVVQVFELESIGDDELYMALEWVDGFDLKQVLKRAARAQRMLPTWACVSVAMQVLEALAFAHELRDAEGRRRNIVHCDVTPENIFVSRTGEVKLGDFGVAHDDTRADEAFEGQIKGKVTYLSPEQINGQRPDHRADVFSCGIVLWESLTLHRLFASDTPTETMSRICVAPRTPPSAMRHDIPPALDRIVLRALEPDLHRRTPSAKTMQNELRAVLNELDPALDPMNLESLVRELVTGEASAPYTLSNLSNPALDSVPDAPALELPDIVDDGSEEVTLACEEAEFSYEDELAVKRLTSPSEGFTYSIIKPPHAVEALPAIPMLGGPANVETGDLLRKKATIVPPISAAPGRNNTEDIIKGRPLAPPGSLFLRTPTHKTLGPIDALEVLGALSDLIDDSGSVSDIEVSGDGMRWMPWARFGELLGEGIVAASPVLPNNQFSGTIEVHSLAAIFGQLARTRSSGRLILVRYTAHGVDRREICVERGCLVGIFSSQHPFAAWDKLINDRVNRPPDLAVHLQQVATRAVSIQDVASPLVLNHVASARAGATQRALREIFAWEQAHFGFDPSAGLHHTTSPIPLCSLLPSTIAHAIEHARLQATLSPTLDTTFVRTDRFDDEVEALGLRSGPTNLVAPFGHGYTLGESLAQCVRPEEVRAALVVAYLLVELGLLAPDERVLHPAGG